MRSMASAPRSGSKAPAIKPGELVLDRYRVLEQIGSGGHSLVFKGNDERLSRPVCIKVFSGLGAETGVGRTSYEHFVQEAFALSRLTHPNTLRIYDFGHLGPKDVAGLPLQVCEYMNGGTLSQIVREHGRQTLAETVRVTNAMCAALAEAHGLGIVHRDIKPQNILFGSVGAAMLPKLADFGIAKWSVDDENAKTNIAEDTAIVAGQKLAMYSPSWAAPEQLAGQPVSPSTDIYSLACVAIYMISARAIFADEDVYAGYKKRRNADPLVRETLAPLGLPKAMVDVLARALAFDPKKRLAKVDELADELTSVLTPALEPLTDSDLRTVPEINPMTPTHPVPSLMRPDSMASGTETAPLLKRGARATQQPLSHAQTSPSSQQPIATPHPPPAPATGSLPGHGADPTPATFHAPATQAWMAHAHVPTGVPRRLVLTDSPQIIGDRRVHTVMAHDAVDLAGNHGIKIRITLLPGPSGQRVIHLKGLSCFVSHLGGRPSPAVTLDRGSDIALVTPRAQEIGHLRVAQGSTSRGQTVFPVGSELVALGIDDCADPILFDFGPGSEVYFVYTRGRTAPKSGRRA
jgi:serine/threonine-protein kinase